MISFIVLDPAKLLAAELSIADRLATTGIASPFSQGHAFISYVREDADKVEELQRFLQASGIPVWLDTAEISPGADWSFIESCRAGLGIGRTAGELLASAIS